LAAVLKGPFFSWLPGNVARNFRYGTTDIARTCQINNHRSLFVPTLLSFLQVAVLIDLKARIDEARYVGFAQKPAMNAFFYIRESRLPFS
jgi:hypothetical protein